MNDASEVARRQRGLTGELALALPPTLTVLAVLLLLERVGGQRLLFASLASSAFLVYLDPHHRTNRVRTLMLAQGAAALLGAAFAAFGPGYVSAGSAMVAVIVLMVVLDVVHPPAVSTALAFGFRQGPESNLLVFAVALGMVALLVLLQRASIWLLGRMAA